MPLLHPSFKAVRVGIAVGLLLAVPGPSTAESDRIDGFLRGVVVSCPRAGEIWGSDDMRESLETLTTLGVDWVSIHPYGWIGRDGSIRFQPAAETGYLERAVQLARDAGVELFWKPHLGYWRSFEWRGAIEFGNDEGAWRRFFDDYRAFIVDQARFAERSGVPLFAVGVETDQTVGRETDWRRVIAAVREVYSGEITYAANWDRIGDIPFWDAVDWIGVHAYFPVGTDANPSPEEIDEAWNRHLDQLSALSVRHGDRPVLMAEIGYNRSPDAAREPWDYSVDDTSATRELRERLISAALERAERDPVVRGMFWWKWMPGRSYHGRNFSMRDDEAMRALATAWGPAATDASTTGE